MQDILPPCPELAYVKPTYFTNVFTNIFPLSHQILNSRNVGTLFGLIAHFYVPSSENNGQ